MNGFHSPLGRNSNLNSQRSKRGKSKKKMSLTKERSFKDSNELSDKNIISAALEKNYTKNRSFVKVNKNLEKKDKLKDLIKIEDEQLNSKKMKSSRGITYNNHQITNKSKRNTRMSARNPGIGYEKPKRSFRKSEHVRKSQKLNKTVNSKTKPNKRKAPLNGGSSASKLYVSPNKTSYLGTYDRIPNYKSPGKSKGNKWTAAVKPRSKKDSKKKMRTRRRKHKNLLIAPACFIDRYLKNLSRERVEKVLKK